VSKLRQEQRAHPKALQQGEKQRQALERKLEASERKQAGLERDCEGLQERLTKQEAEKAALQEQVCAQQRCCVICVRLTSVLKANKGLKALRLKPQLFRASLCLLRRPYLAAPTANLSLAACCCLQQSKSDKEYRHCA
jgi:uncharacterized protein YhaN